jgi:hypothetical protein
VTADIKNPRGVPGDGGVERAVRNVILVRFAV